jgi:hypothetical protein
VDALAQVKVNLADGRGAGLWGDSKDDDDVAWEGAAKWQRG